MPTEKFPGKYENLAKIGEFVELAAGEAGFNEVESYAIKLAVDEACSNIIEHAYGGEDIGDIQCTCEVTNNGLKIILCDQGRPFDPESVPKPNFRTPLEMIKPGGAGLYLINSLMDEVNFEFTKETGNILTMVKRKEK